MNNITDTKPVLVAIDFSTDSEAALLWASHYISHIQAPLIILHVVHDPADTPGFYRREKDDWTEPLAAVASRMAEDFIKKMQKKYPKLSCLQDSRIEFISGLPPGRIVEFAKKEQAQLIVIGSCGRSGLSHILLGSVAERVAQISDIPVVIVKSPANIEEKHE